MSDQNEIDNIRRRWLRHKPIAYVAVFSIIFAFCLDLIKDSVEAWRSFIPRSHYYARDLADEYYILVDRVPDPEAAIELRKKLVDLSYGSMAAQVENDMSVEGGAYGFLSSTVKIGFDPDMVLYAKDDQTEGMWIVGLDVERHQGELRNTLEALNVIRRGIKNVEGEFTGSERQALADIAREVSPLFEDAEVRFFDSVSYEQLYGPF